MHEGHRSRLYQKLKDGDNLFEHEILEMLLFNAYPRKNTNPIAHALLERFPSISAVLSADIDSLQTVPGVGEQVALYLRCVGLCIEKSNDAQCFAVFTTRGDFYKFIRMRMRGLSNEVLEFYFLDKNGKLTRIVPFTSHKADKVAVPPEEIIKLISVNRPYGLVMAHNHPNGIPQPSAVDDNFTKQCQLICSMNNVQLYDHVIYAGDDDIYSYFDSGKLDVIAREFSINSVLNNGKSF